MVNTSNDSNDDPLRRLREHASYIEVKFQAGRSHDISVELVKQIIQETTRLRKNPRSEFAKESLTEIENNCYASILDYQDIHARENYFSRLRQISKAIQHLEN